MFAKDTSLLQTTLQNEDHIDSVICLDGAALPNAANFANIRDSLTDALIDRGGEGMT